MPKMENWRLEAAEPLGLLCVLGEQAVVDGPDYWLGELSGTTRIGWTPRRRDPVRGVRIAGSQLTVDTGNRFLTWDPALGDPASVPMVSHPGPMWMWSLTAAASALPRFAPSRICVVHVCLGPGFELWNAVLSGSGRSVREARVGREDGCTELTYLWEGDIGPMTLYFGPADGWGAPAPAGLLALAQRAFPAPLRPRDARGPTPQHSVVAGPQGVLIDPEDYWVPVQRLQRLCTAPAPALRSDVGVAAALAARVGTRQASSTHGTYAL